MRRRIVLAIAAKELAAIRKSRALWLPMVLLPALLFIVIPAVVAAGVGRYGSDADLQKLIAHLPAALRTHLGDPTAPGFQMRAILRQMLAPLGTLVPVLVASVMAADAFAGERERKTLEPLLHSPATDVEIFAGKVLGAFVPALGTNLFGFAGLVAVVNLLTARRLGVFIPDGGALLLVLWLAPAASGIAISVMVFISSRVKGFQEANQLGVLVVLPVMALLIAQSSGALFLPSWAIFVAGAALFALDVALVRLAAAAFTRDRLFARL